MRVANVMLHATLQQNTTLASRNVIDLCHNTGRDPSPIALGNMDGRSRSILFRLAYGTVRPSQVQGMIFATRIVSRTE